MSLKINIIQPSFAPWIGFFEQIKNSDIHCFLINVNYSLTTNFKRTKLYEFNLNNYFWFNGFIGKMSQNNKLYEFKISDYKNNINQLIKYFEFNKKKFKYYKDILEILNKIKIRDFKYIYEINIFLIKEICNYFDYKKKFVVLNDNDTINDKNDFLISVVKKYNADKYISGHGFLKYGNLDKFCTNNIEVKIMKYKNLDYSKNGLFIPYLSILDLIGKCGKEGEKFLCSEALTFSEFKNSD